MAASAHVTADAGAGFRVVRLSGGREELGRQHGEQLGPLMRSLRQGLHDEVINRRGRLLGWGAESVLRLLASRMESHIPPHLQREMQAVAVAADLPYPDVLLMNCLDDAAHNLQFLVPVGRLACSAVAVQGSRAPDGVPLLARNLDYYPETDWWGAGEVVNRALRQAIVVFVVRPEPSAPTRRKPHAFVSVAWPGFVGAVTGVNDAGLGVACLTSTVPNETTDGQPALLMYRRMLEEAETLADCERILRSTPRTIGNTLLVVSAQEKAACALEFSPRQVAVRRPTDDLLLATNHFQHPALEDEQAGWVLPNSVARLARLRELSARGIITARRAQTILSDHADPEDRNCIHNRSAVYSTVIDPVGMRLWLRGWGRPQRDFSAIDLAALLRDN